jgi:hypothetical protein
MTKTPLIAFRCPDDLRKALDAESAESGRPISEIIQRMLCKRYKVKYVARPNGRPKAEK